MKIRAGVIGRRGLCLALTATLWAATLRGAFEGDFLSARSAALCGALTASSGAEAAVFNPAGAGSLRRPSFLVSYTRLFNDPEMPEMSFVFSGPVNDRFGLSAAYRQFGPPIYQERMIVLAGGAGLGERLHVGMAARLQRLAVRRYGSTQGAGLDAGLSGKINDRLTVGLFARNLVMPRNGKLGATPPVLRAGLSFAALKNARLTLDGSRESPGKSSFRAGQEVDVSPHFTLRWGFRGNPGRYAVGFGVGAGRVRVDYALVTHARLGPEHHTGMTWRWGK